LILFLSDLHLDYLSPEEIILLRKLLTEELQGFRMVIFNGDLFDSPSRGRSVLNELMELLDLLDDFADAGGEILYIIGNHDIGMTAVAGSIKKLNAKIVYPREIIVIDGRRFLVEHGHHCDPLFKTSMYDFLRIFEDRLNLRFGDMAEKLIERIAQKFQTVQKDRFGVPDSVLSIWEVDAFNKADKENVDAVIYGHTHAPIIRSRGNRVYINTGSWIENLNYAIYDEGRFSIFKYASSKPELVAEFRF
jgi:UDP-2,3-diacylglucosamine pyrophosphatase LpxH